MFLGEVPVTSSHSVVIIVILKMPRDPAMDCDDKSMRHGLHGAYIKNYVSHTPNQSLTPELSRTYGTPWKWTESAPDRRGGVGVRRP